MLKIHDMLQVIECRSKRRAYFYEMGEVDEEVEDGDEAVRSSPVSSNLQNQSR